MEQSGKFFDVVSAVVASLKGYCVILTRTILSGDLWIPDKNIRGGHKSSDCFALLARLSGRQAMTVRINND